MLDKQDIKLTKTLKRIPPNGGVFLPFGTYYFIKKLPLMAQYCQRVGDRIPSSSATKAAKDFSLMIYS